MMKFNPLELLLAAILAELRYQNDDRAASSGGMAHTKKALQVHRNNTVALLEEIHNVSRAEWNKMPKPETLAGALGLAGLGLTGDLLKPGDGLGGTDAPAETAQAMSERIAKAQAEADAAETESNTMATPDTTVFGNPE